MSELITVQDFARKYSVDTETVRSWIKNGYIPYELVGHRKMIRKDSALTKPIEVEEPVVGGQIGRRSKNS